MASFYDAEVTTPRRTFLYKKTISLKWIINDVNMLGNNTKLRSPSYEVLLSRHVESCFTRRELKCTWNMFVERSHKLWSIGYDCYRLHQEGLVDVRISFLNPETQESVYSITFTHQDFNERVSRTGIKLDEYLYNYTLSIRLEAELLLGDSTVYNVPQDNIREDMVSTLYRSAVFTDMVIKCEDKEFRVHKAVLAMQSPVFV